MLGFGWQELIIILIIVLIIFGAGKLSGVGSALGRGISDFKSEAGSGDTEKPIEGGSSRRASSVTSGASQARDDRDGALVGSGASSATRERRETRPEDI